MAFAGVGLPAQCFGGTKVDKACGADRIIGVEQRLDHVAFEVRASDGGGDTITGHFCERHEHELGGISVPFADEALVEPLVGDPFQSAEEMKFSGGAGVRHFVLIRCLVRWNRRVERRKSLVWPRLRSTLSPMMPALVVWDGPIRSGVSSSIESSLNSAVSCSLADRHGNLLRVGSGSQDDHDRV